VPKARTDRVPVGARATEAGDLVNPISANTVPTGLSQLLSDDATPAAGFRRGVSANGP
jgi:hypothetical protein